MEIAPAIFRMHPELDSQQREVIAHADGPLLVIAGPGSGKTLCIQLRAVNLLLSGRAAPEELVLCTFGRDAAYQLRCRFAASAQACRTPGQFSRVCITTIHGLCHRVLALHAGAAGLSPGYGLLNEEDQLLLLHREYGPIFGPDRDALADRGWRDGVRTAVEAARYFDRICDEMITTEVLEASRQPFSAALGRCLRRYRNLLLKRNLVDFAHLQVWAEQVLRDDAIAAEQGGAIRHLMVDEGQDTSRVQLCVLSRLASSNGNIVVVGDDDQSIYRFRGGRVANLMEFPDRFPGCRVLKLTTNYRSHRGITAATARWMDTAAQWEVDGQAFRYAKSITAHGLEAHADYPAVLSVRAEDSTDEARQLAELLRFLRRNGVIDGYSGTALLLHSVRDGVSVPYLDAFESAGIPARCEPAGHGPSSANDEVVITTIHQAKGRQWDVVIAGSLTEPDMETDRVGRDLADYIESRSGEPVQLIGDFDRARLHYVAFSRARRLLVLTSSGEPHQRFRSIWNRAARWPDVDREALAHQRFGSASVQQCRQTANIERLDRMVVRLVQPGRVWSDGKSHHLSRD